MTGQDADAPTTNGENRPDSSASVSDGGTRIDDRMGRLVADQLTADERASLERAAADDPVLRRQLEAFRPLPRERLDAIARLGLANRDPSGPLPTSRRRFGAWMPVLGVVAVAGVAAVWVLPRATPRYQLEAELGSSPVGFDAPIRLRLVPEPPSAPPPVEVEVWAGKGANAPPTRVRIPVRKTRDGRIEIAAPAHRVTGGRFGSVELDVVVAERRRSAGARYPDPTDPGIHAILRTAVDVGPPTYEVAYLAPTGKERTRASAGPDGPTIELRPAVPVRSGLHAHLYAVEGNGAVRVDVDPQPVGDQGVLRLPLPADAAAGGRWIVAVGPSATPLPADEVWTHGRRVERVRDGWWLKVIDPQPADNVRPDP